MLNSRRVVTIVIAVSMLLAGACAAPRTNYELNDPEFLNRMGASAKQKERERVAAGKGDYMAPLYESVGAGDHEAAIEKCEEYRELRPDDPVIYMLEGNAYFRKGELSTAIDRLSNAIAIDSSLWPAYYLRGLSYRGLKEHRKALEDMDKLASSKYAPAQLVQYYNNFGEFTEDYMNGLIFFNRAMMLHDEGDTVAAIVSMDRAIGYYQLDSDFYLWRGVFYFYQQQYVLAYSDIEKTIELSPSDFPARNLAGVINSRLGDYNRAVMQLSKANELKPGDVNCLTNLGLAYWLRGDQVMAFEAMGEALRGEPTYNTYFHTAYFYHASGGQEKALEYYRKSYELNRDVLKNFTSGMNSIPVTSPTRKFFSDELAVAEKYLAKGGTPAEIFHRQTPPTLEITSVTLEPNPVRVNTPFDFHVSYKVDVPGSPENTLPIILKFTILRGNKVLFSSEPIHMDADNGGSKKWALHMNPVPKEGTYTIEVVIKHQELASKKSTELLIN